jgi:hypothetical protein
MGLADLTELARLTIHLRAPRLALVQAPGVATPGPTGASAP